LKANTPKKIVCSVLISLLQFGGNAYIAEAASRSDQRRTYHESRDTRDNFDRRHHERVWQEKRDIQQRELAHWRHQSDQRFEQSLQRHEREHDRAWRHRQWLEEQRLQHQREEMRRRQWWEHQRYEQAMRRLSHENEREWRHRQWLEEQRHEHEMRQIEIIVLSLLLATR